MAKADYIGNISSVKNVNKLKGKFSNKRVLVISNNISEIKDNNEIFNFFDLVIAQGFEALKCCPKPDVFVDHESSPYVKSHLRENRYHGLENTLICLNFRNALEMKRASLKYKNYMLTYMPVDVVPNQTIKVVDDIKFGLSELEPGVHLAKACGSNEVFSTGESKVATHLTPDLLIEFLNEEIKTNQYVTQKKNFIRRRARLYLDENGI